MTYHTRTHPKTSRMDRPEAGLPSRKQILDFIADATEPAGKREIARAFGLKGQEKITLKALLKDMAEEGLIDGNRTAYHRMGGVPRVTVLRVIEIDEGDAIAVPDTWASDDGASPPRLRIVTPKAVRPGRGPRVGPSPMGALAVGDRILARTEEGADSDGDDKRGGWLAYPMKKLAAQSDSLMGVIKIDGTGRAWLAPIDKRVRHAEMVSDSNGAREGQLVLAEPVGRMARSGVKVTQILGDPLAPRSFSLIAIHKYGLPHIFSSEALAEAETAARQTLAFETGEGGREDLTHLPIVAIDPEDARDHDDAIWATRIEKDSDGKGGWEAVVAIADVSFYVRPGGALDREARQRGNSVYFPDRVVPMLPEILSADVCSLKAGAVRAAMVCHLTIADDGRLTNWRFARARVRIAENIAYEEAQRRIDAGEAEPHLVDLWAAWRALAQDRARRNPLDLDSPERRVVLDTQGQIVSVAARQRLDSHRVVEDFMIAANVAAAKALESRKQGVVYRIHEPPSREKLVALKDYLTTFGLKLALGQVITPALFNRILGDITDPAQKALITEAVLRSQMQAYYGPRNAGHFGLALGSYAHFTSPIRRYADLLIHRALVDGFGLEQTPSKDISPTTGLSARDRADLAPICEAISTIERRAMDAERETLDRYVAAWLASQIGDVFDCRVTGVQSFGLFATILDTQGLSLGDGLVPVSVLGNQRFHYDEKARALIGEDGKSSFAVGDRLRLRLAEANPLTGALKFEPEDGPGGLIDPRGGAAYQPERRSKNHPIGKRGRPANIRHQSRKR